MCIQVIGAEKFEFRFLLLPYHAGFQQFKEGVSKLGQVTGREHHNIEQYMVSTIEGAVTKGFLIAIRALMNFCYLALAPEINNNTCDLIDHTLKEFHEIKQAILNVKACLGKGNKPIDNWYIPN